MYNFRLSSFFMEMHYNIKLNTESIPFSNIKYEGIEKTGNKRK